MSKDWQNVRETANAMSGARLFQAEGTSGRKLPRWGAPSLKQTNKYNLLKKERKRKLPRYGSALGVLESPFPLVSLHELIIHGSFFSA